MKKLILVCLSLLISISSFANEKLCKSLYEAKSIYSKEISEHKKSVKFNKWEQKMVVSYVTYGEGMYDDEGELMTNFSQVREEYENGYDELTLSLVKAQDSGVKYVRVWSYPGDNEYGVYMTTKGKVIAEIQDGELQVDGKYCEIQYEEDED